MLSFGTRISSACMYIGLAGTHGSPSEHINVPSVCMYIADFGNKCVDVVFAEDVEVPVKPY
jgi:hypothetical protein